MTLQSKIESLLFMAQKELTSQEIAQFLEASPEEVSAALDDLSRYYNEGDRGINLVRLGDSYRLAANPRNSIFIDRFLSKETDSQLTRPSLETLSIIAYRGPISQADLEYIRGVNCSQILRNLALRGLIQTVPERDKFYQVSLDFMRLLGLRKIEELAEYQKWHDYKVNSA
ncbi:MAG: SMC-Scp complex subunit ScpB [Parcubacteria group bacterium]|nr:SMC-Scp complex subunit ScpB [Parcubacteria group bacterium]